MKKWLYLLSGVVIGAVVATSSSAFAAQIKSLVGQKVTGEYTVVVNGKTLSDKGAVINGRTNAPVRALSDALGADLKVEGKTITVTTEGEAAPSNEGQPTSVSSTNKFMGQPKSSLLNSKDIIENKILAPTIKGRENILAEIKSLKETEAKGIPVPVLAEKEKQLQQYDADIAKYTEELRQVNEALAALEK
ncbi:stalk domain-containing protein [Paenibacillus sp. USDA918EY]|uniref:stalk domain-containing protein n=1 Tax=Paenibacillus sp. USDA918EY TaxID=2689575 RepID=UPI00135830C3|nr:stalk domain-containing protein [Paenibacillus sp. USDA918EY]